MAVIDDKILLKQIKNKEFARVYFLYGEERYMLDGCLNKLVQPFAEGPMAEFNYQKIDAEKASMDDIESAVETLPVMAEKKCVLITNCRIDKLVKADNDRIKALLKDFPESTVLIFSGQGMDVDIKRNSKWKTFVNSIGKLGHAVECSHKPKSELARILVNRAKKEHTEMSLPAANQLIGVCGADLNTLLMELDKLIRYRFEKEITVEDVQNLAIPTIEASSFDLAKAVLAKNYDRSYALLQQLLYLRQDEVAILAAVSMSFIDIYRARTALDAGKNTNDILQMYNYKGKEFRIRNAYRDCAKYSPKVIDQCMSILVEADRKMKSTKADNSFLLEEVLAKMIALAA